MYDQTILKSCINKKSTYSLNFSKFCLNTQKDSQNPKKFMSKVENEKTQNYGLLLTNVFLKSARLILNSPVRLIYKVSFCF